MKKKLLIILSSMIVILLAGLLFAGNYFYNQGIKRGTEVELHRGSDADDAPSEETDSSKNETDKKTTPVDQAENWYLNQDKKTLSMKSYDDLSLQATYIDHEADNHKTVILAHGFRNTKEDMGKYAKMYHDQGYNILLPDARGHGDSEGDYIGYGWHDRLDYLDWMDRVIDDYGTKEIILHGESMGVATVLMSSGEDLPEQVKGIVADSAYSTVKQELAHQLKHLYNLPAFPLLDVTSLITQVRAGYMLGEASTGEQVKENTLPLPLIHGKDDELVPTEMSEDIHDAADDNKDLWLVPDTGHAKAFDNKPEKFQNRIKQFLNRALNE